MYYDEYLKIFVDTFSAVLVMAHPLISCIVYGTQNDNYHNQLSVGDDVLRGDGDSVVCFVSLFSNISHHALNRPTLALLRENGKIDCCGT